MSTSYIKSRDQLSSFHRDPHSRSNKCNFFIHQISSQSFLSILLKTPPKKIHNIDNPRHPSHHHNTFQSLSINQKKNNPNQTRSRLRLLLRLPRNHALILREPQTDAVDAVPLVRRRRVPLPLEHMPQVPAAVGADDLGALHAERGVEVPVDRPGDAVVVGGPAAAGLELVRGAVQGGVAAGAGVDALGGEVVVVFAGEGGLGALFAEDAELFCGC